MPRIEDITFYPNRLGKNLGNSWWDSYEEDKPYKDPKQLEMEFLWPHNAIQLDLGLEVPETKKLYTVDNSLGSPFLFGTATGTTVAPTLSVAPTNSVGQLSIGGIQIGIEKKPSLVQRMLYKLLGFNWKDKQ